MARDLIHVMTVLMLYRVLTVRYTYLRDFVLPLLPTEWPCLGVTEEAVGA